MDKPNHIEVEAHGPYVVYGELPLVEVAQVQTFNGEPIAWHELGDVAAPEGQVRLCRCGQSAEKPFCDDSHLTSGFTGAEVADRRPFRERAQEHHGTDAAIADDGALCISAGFCGTRTTDVWKLLQETADPERYALMRDMTWRCPSGRIVLLDGGGNEVEPELRAEIAILPGGPLWLRGGIEVIGADGVPWETRNRVALCRCGESGNKPFCDGTHSSLHFDER